jgi:hypothetical protein
MKSGKRGKNISGTEVTNVSQHGFWLLIDGRELFLPFDKFPWFRDVPIGHLFKVEQLHSSHLYWPDLDIDLSVESIEFPERFPLISKAKSAIGRMRTQANGASAKLP